MSLIMMISFMLYTLIHGGIKAVHIPLKDGPNPVTGSENKTYTRWDPGVDFDLLVRKVDEGLETFTFPKLV